MIEYFVVLALALLLSWLYSNSKSSILLFLVITILALFVGLRSYEVGTDSEGYARMYLESKYFQSAESAANNISTEDGWNILNWFLYQINPHYWFLFTVVGFITVSCAVCLIKKESPAPTLSLFLYITLGFYLFGFAGMRQSVALAIYWLAIPFLFSKKIWWYVSLVILASFFHRTVLIALPLYFVFTMRYSHKLMILLVIGSIIVGSFLPVLMAFSADMESRYSVYMEIEGGGQLFAVFYVLMAFFFWTQRTKIIHERQTRYDTLLMMLVVGAVIYLIVTLAGVYSEVTRLALYFQISIIFLWAELYKSRKNKLNTIIWITCYGVHLVYYFIYLSKIGGTVPYIVNSSFQ